MSITIIAARIVRTCKQLPCRFLQHVACTIAGADRLCRGGTALWKDNNNTMKRDAAFDRHSVGDLQSLCSQTVKLRGGRAAALGVRLCLVYLLESRLGLQMWKFGPSRS